MRASLLHESSNLDVETSEDGCLTARSQFEYPSDFHW